ncbi:MAG: WYL domain-containing protein [Leptospira sp.]|nr:WYL domain-containing protein [Leptospira sp.]
MEKQKKSKEVIAPKEINETESRQLTLFLNLLKSKNGMPFSRIKDRMKDFYNNDQTESDEKKIQRDIRELKKLGFTVKFYKSHLEYGGIDSNVYKLEIPDEKKRLRFAEDELRELSLLIFRNFRSTKSRDLFTTAQKIFSSEFKFFPDLTQEDSVEKTDSSVADILSRVIESIRGRIPVRIAYRKNSYISLENRDIEPHQILRKDLRDFYLIAYDRDKKAYRKFIIPKIETVSDLPGNFIHTRVPTADDLNFHPLNFKLHDPETLEIICNPKLMHLILNFITPHPFGLKDNHLSITTTNRNALFDFAIKEPQVIQFVNSKKFLEGLNDHKSQIKNYYL